MTTTEPNNCAVSPAIHSLGRCRPSESTQTAYAAQLAVQLRPFYAKQTQFAACSNERNYCSNKGLSKYSTLPTPAKQTQFRTHHPRTAQPTIKMQNKPNFSRAKMNLTPYCKKDYAYLRLHSHLQNKPNLQSEFIPTRRDLGFRYSPLVLQHNHRPLILILHRRIMVLTFR